MKKIKRYPTAAQRKKKKTIRNLAISISAFAAACCAAVIVISGLDDEPSKPAIAPADSVSVTAVTEATLPPIAEVTVTHTETEPEEEPIIFTRPMKTENTKEFSDMHVTARNGILIDAETGEVLGRKSSLKKIYPASMTKVMTLLVAVENLTESDMEQKVTMTYDMLAPLIADNASRVGYEVDEEASVRDMLYGLILPSGADAAVGLSQYIAGNEENFVKLMNEKAVELGLEETHFENCTGLHGKSHYTTCVEMSMIMKAAMENPLCKEILSTYTYTTEATEQHPDGIPLYSNMFSRMYGDEVEDVIILSGKTGYTDQAAHCLVTYAEKDDHGYISVIGGDYDKYAAVYSTFAIYENYLP